MIRTLCCIFCFISSASVASQLVIAHRGASGYLPEHTLESAILAHAQGADYIEQDLVLSMDHVPVVLHDIHLETVTDVEQVFPDRNREDGRYYALDFTLAELKQLRVHERQTQDGQQVFPGRFAGQSQFRIATFEEQIALIQHLNRQLGTHTGLYPEIKSPAWHRQQGADISAIVMAVLNKHQLNGKDKRIIVQCFDFAETQRLRNELGYRGTLVQLLAENSWGESTSDYDYLKSSKGLDDIAKVADGIGPWIPQLLDVGTGQPTALVSNAKQAGLLIHPYTLRNDQLPEGMTPAQLVNLLFNTLSVDGVFTDFPDTVKQAL